MAALARDGSGPLVEVRGLRKEFRDVVAVRGLDLDLRRGEIYGFLGRNGAGKTTTIKMALGLTFPTAGTVRIRGVDVLEDPVAARASVGYLPEKVAFYENLTARQTLEFFAEMKGAPKATVPEWLERVGLGDASEKKVGKFSKGMTQLLGVAQAFLGGPELLVLDEPTGGLDPEKTHIVRDMIRGARAEGATVFFSSHILSEVQEICDRVGVLESGNLVGEDTPADLSKRLNVHPVLEVWLEEGDPRARATVEGVPGVTSVRAEGAFLSIECEARARAEILAALAREGMRVRDMRTKEPSLEEAFLRLTARRREAQ